MHPATSGLTYSRSCFRISCCARRAALREAPRYASEGSKSAAGRVGQQAQPQQHQQPRSNANGLHGSSAEPPDAAADPPQSAFAADEVQTTAGGAAAGGSASGAMDPAVGLAPGAPQAAPPGGRGDTAAAAPQEAVESAALTPSLASRLEAGTGILALSQVCAMARGPAWRCCVVFRRDSHGSIAAPSPTSSDRLSAFHLPSGAIVDLRSADASGMAVMAARRHFCRPTFASRC